MSDNQKPVHLVRVGGVKAASLANIRTHWH